MKVSVIGTGFGERVMAVVWRRLGCDVEVISPRDREGIERACASGVDLVSIHSPPFLHRDHVMLALQHGRHVLCDKPFGRDAREAEAMRDAALSAGVLHFLNFEFRCHPVRQQAKALIDAGAIGTLRHINWSFIGNGLRNQKFRWLFDKDQAGGWIGAYGSHAIDAMRVLFGDEVEDCGGIMRTETVSRLDRDGAKHPATAEDAFTGWFAMRGGGTACLDTAFSSAAALQQRVNLLGSEGTIEIIDELVVRVLRPGEEPQVHQFAASDWDSHEPGLVPWLTAVRDAVAAGRQITPSFEDGLAVARTMDRMRKTMRHLTARQD